MGHADRIKSDTDGLDIWIATGYEFCAIAPFHNYQILFYFRQKFLTVFDSRRKDRPVYPLYEIVSIHQRYRDEIEPGGESVNVFRTRGVDTSPDELLALFSCEYRVLSRLWSIQRYEGRMEQLKARVENANLL